MTISTALWSFALVAGLMTLTPGLDTALILRTAALGQRRRAWGVVLGIQAGTLVWGAFASLGITALLTASHLAYTTLRWVGAAYLLWMGVRMIWTSRRHLSAEAAADAEPEPDRLRDGLRRGAFTNLLNPKVGAMYMALLPQFIPADVPHLPFGMALASIHVAFGLAWSSVLVTFAHALRSWLAKPSARRLMDRVTGTVIAAFGLRLAFGD
ncbi:LysE family translocator [Actinomadura rupiterrae]|uniref:LysE family translocator n=1 Tax=Actinomadura rupiterrae TaxID=559627 RepID=UPI0020A548A7|nr:LysE family translocator [Actinomadura rupiterrae]MCP2337700.1 threonine/homoserine/homoserine lactone efflux protein [Actinomadura rupiterrae]